MLPKKTQFNKESEVDYTNRFRRSSPGFSIQHSEVHPLRFTSSVSRYCPIRACSVLLNLRQSERSNKARMKKVNMITIAVKRYCEKTPVRPINTADHGQENRELLSMHQGIYRDERDCCITEIDVHAPIRILIIPVGMNYRTRR